MNALQWWVVGWAVAALTVIYAAGWVYARCPRWFLRCTCRLDLPGPDLSMPAPGAGEYQAWDELVQRDPERAALTLIAEWHDDTQERTVTGDVWDQWWNGVDGLERECMLVHDWLVREERLWAELKAETREMCAA